LLLATLEPDTAACERYIRDTATAAIFSKHANLLRTGSRDELEILYACSLGDLIVDTRDSRSGADFSDINNDVAYLAIEIGCVDVISKGTALFY